MLESTVYFTDFFDGVPNEVDSKIRYYSSFFLTLQSIFVVRIDIWHRKNWVHKCGVYENIYFLAVIVKIMIFPTWLQNQIRDFGLLSGVCIGVIP